MSDPIADLLTRIRNAVQARHETLLVPRSKLKLAILGILKSEGYIEDFESLDTDVQGQIRVWPRYDGANKGVIRGLERISRPSRRKYVGKDDIPRVRNGLGVAILTTPRGVLSDRDARREGVGGEVLCYVW